jgi:hypothetical protein
MATQVTTLYNYTWGMLPACRISKCQIGDMLGHQATKDADE